jgi:hypothetical protein
MVVGLARRDAENKPPPARLFRRPAQAAPFPQPQHFTNTAPTGTATNHSDYVSIPRGKEAGGGAWHVTYSLLEPRPTHPTPRTHHTLSAYPRPKGGPEVPEGINTPV